MGHYFPVGCVRLGILKRWSSSPQTGVNLASQPQTQLFHSSSFLFFHSGSRSPARLSQFAFSLTSLSSTPICVGLRICWLVSKLPWLWIFPSLVCFPLSCCLPVPLFSILCIFSLPLQGRSVCATVPECWTLRCWSVRLRNRFVQRWGGEILGASPSSPVDQDKCYSDAVCAAFVTVLMITFNWNYNLEKHSFV